MNSTTHVWRNDYTPRRRPMDPMARRRPMDPTARRRPMDHTAHRMSMDPTARRRPMDPTARRRPMVTTVCVLPWWLWPSYQKQVIMATRKTRKKNCSDYKQTTKQDNKEINKQATNARLLRLLHILHPLGIKVRHQCKYREQSSILHTLSVKIVHRCK